MPWVSCLGGHWASAAEGEVEAVALLAVLSLQGSYLNGAPDSPSPLLLSSVTNSTPFLLQGLNSASVGARIHPTLSSASTDILASS